MFPGSRRAGLAVWLLALDGHWGGRDGDDREASTPVGSALSR